MTGFSDPILTGDGSLIREAAKSPNYAAGTAGWSINQDGSAEFNALTVRGRIVVQSSTQGIFVYSGTPALGNLIVAISSVNGTDPYGNSYSRGIHVIKTSGGPYTSLHFDQQGFIEFLDLVSFVNAQIYATTIATGATSGKLNLISPTGNTSAVLATTAQVVLGGMSQDGTVASSILLTGKNAVTDAQLPTTVQVNGDMSVTGVLTAANIASGAVTITPVANTPTSATVSGLSVAGSTFVGQATASTAVIGSTVMGVAVSSVTASSLLVWVYRTNTTGTGVYWMVIGK